MTIIFDSETQKEQFLCMMSASVYCPSDLFLSEDPLCNTDKVCPNCWEDAIEMEVKSDAGV